MAAVRKTAVHKTAARSDGGGGGGSQQASNDDLKVFGYATADEAQLAGEIALVSGTVAQLATDAAARDLDATRADAAILLDQARTLEADANSATQRQKPLDPADPTLAKARGDAIDAFGLTAEYAATVVDLAEAALDLNLAQLSRSPSRRHHSRERAPIWSRPTRI